MGTFLFELAGEIVTNGELIEQNHLIHKLLGFQETYILQLDACWHAEVMAHYIVHIYLLPVIKMSIQFGRIMVRIFNQIPVTFPVLSASTRAITVETNHLP